MKYQTEKDTEAIESLWHAIEEEHAVPDQRLLLHLSGLLKQSQARLAEAWPDLPEEKRHTLIQRLAKMAEKDIHMDFKAIFRLALDDPYAAVRAAAIGGLWEDQDIRLIPRLAHFLRDDESEAVRVAAAQCLAHFILLGELQKIRKRPYEKAYRALRSAYRDEEESIEVRRRALESIAYASRDEVRAMIKDAYEHPNERLQVSAVFAMGRSADRHWKVTVIRHLHNPNPEMRFEAVRACGELEISDVRPELIELTEDADPEIQQAAIWALGQVGGKRARRTLEHYRESDNEALQAAAKAALQQFEFLHGDLSRFYGPPEEFDGESDVDWSEDLRFFGEPEP
jgi:HEAT repeat protein